MNPTPRVGQRYFYKDGGQEGILELVEKRSGDLWNVKVIDSTSNKLGYHGGQILRG